MIRNKLKLYPYHTLLVIPFIVVFLYAQNPGQAEPSMTYRILLGGVAISCVLYGLFYFAFKDRLKAGVFSTLLLLLIFQYGALYDILESLYYQSLWPLQNIHRYLILFFILICSTSFLLIWKSSHDFIKINYFLNFLVITLILFNLARINTGKTQSFKDTEITNNTDLPLFDSGIEKPNIYYIILDGYARKDVLEKYYGFNNAGFLSQLHKLGFKQCDSAFANFYSTPRSLATTLNMAYPDDSLQSIPLIKNNIVFKTFKNHGYSIYNLYSGYAVTHNFRDSDSTIMVKGPTEFEKGFLKYTIFRLDDFLGFLSHLRLSGQLEKMHDFVNISKNPRLSFMHFVAPHPPYVFDRNGNIRTRHNFAEHSWEPMEFYVDQLIYVNKRISELLEEIVVKDPDAIIILQSDHGPWISPNNGDAIFEARSGILYAYRNIKEVIPQKTSPVNTFRYLFNANFGCKLPVLSDKEAGKMIIFKDPTYLNKIKQ